MTLLFILSLSRQHLPHPIASLIHLPRKQTGHRAPIGTTAHGKPPLEAEEQQSDMMESGSGVTPVTPVYQEEDEAMLDVTLTFLISKGALFFLTIDNCIQHAKFKHTFVSRPLRVQLCELPP